MLDALIAVVRVLEMIFFFVGGVALFLLFAVTAVAVTLWNKETR